MFYRLRMSPVTVGHLAALYDIGIDVFEPIESEEERIIAFVCSGDYRERAKDLSKWWAPMFFRMWGKICGRAGIISDSGFMDWFVKQLHGPITKSKPGLKQSIAAPLHIHLIACCCGMLNMTRDEAMRMTVRDAKQLICALGEARGELQTWTRDDEARRDISVSLGLMEARN